MIRRNWTYSRFRQQEEDPLGPLANLVDIMLVFACGLIVALLALSTDGQNSLTSLSSEILKGKELSDLPKGIGTEGSGFEPVGKVYKDPKTNKLILIGESDQSGSQ